MRDCASASLCARAQDELRHSLSGLSTCIAICKHFSSRFRQVCLTGSAEVSSTCRTPHGLPRDDARFMLQGDAGELRPSTAWGCPRRVPERRSQMLELVAPSSSLPSVPWWSGTRTLSSRHHAQAADPRLPNRPHDARSEGMDRGSQRDGAADLHRWWRGRGLSDQVTAEHSPR